MIKNKNDHPYVGVDAIILDKDDRILLEKRSLDMISYPGFWGIPGGWMEWGETVEDALKREVKEELGINIKVIRFLGKYYDTNNLPIKRYSRIALPHLCEIINGEPTVNQPEEVSEIGWFSFEEALNLNLAYDHKLMIEDLFKNNYEK